MTLVGAYQKPSELDFERDATAVLELLRPALAEVVEHLEPRVARASELRRRLKLSQKTSWGLFTAATSRDVRSLPPLLPGRAAMGRFFEAAAEEGVPAEVINRARDAFARFEETVALHAGSRDDFGAMVSELNGGRGDAGAGAADTRHRRAAFRANALLWGRKAEVSCGLRIVGPSACGGDLADNVLINGMVALQRTRLGVPIQTTERRWGHAIPGGPPEPLDLRQSGPQAIGLLEDFCSKPLPEFRFCESTDAYRKYELISDKLGASGEVTFFTGEVSRGAPAPRPHPFEIAQFRGVGMPMATYIGDIMVHSSFCTSEPPVVGVYAWPLDGPREFRDSDLLPHSEHAEYLGKGVDAARTPLIPHYAQLLAYAMDRMRWKPEEFRLFRCLVEYPLLHTRIRMTLRCNRVAT